MTGWDEPTAGGDTWNNSSYDNSINRVTASVNNWNITENDHHYPSADKFDSYEGHIGDSNANFTTDSEHNAGPSVCRNCNNPGHFARECNEPRKLKGECFNCGEVGHNKADCTNPKVNRPFTGTCYNCGETGHSKADCPNPKADRPLTGECFNCGEVGHNKAECPNPKVNRPFTGTCYNCGNEGHRSAECPEKGSNYSMNHSKIPDMDETAAWEMLKLNSEARDTRSFQDSLKIFAKANREVTYADLEKMFRKAGFNIYLIAQEMDIPQQQMIVNLQGKTDCKYVVGYFYSPNPQRPIHKLRWPESADENLKRLENAGEVMANTTPTCRNCGQLGHLAKACSEEKMTPGKTTMVCLCCGAEGEHLMRDCPNYDISSGRNFKSTANITCRRCNETGHMAASCPMGPKNDGDGPNMACRNCGEVGHFARDCPAPREDRMTCRNCDQVGHVSRDCPEPKDWSRVKCNNCGEMGHTVVKCKKRLEESDVAGDFGDNGGW